MSYLLHLPAKNKELYGDQLKEWFEKKPTFIKPDNVDIIIPITLDQIDDSLLIKQIHNSGYNYYNCIDKEIKWGKADKIKYIYDTLLMCNNEYVLILDGNDIVFTNDLTNIINSFHIYDADIVYNAEIYKLSNGKMHYALNGGACFGTKEGVLKFYTDALDFLNNDKEKFPSEQKYLLQSLFKNSETTAVDCKRELFVCYNYEFKGN